MTDLLSQTQKELAVTLRLVYQADMIGDYGVRHALMLEALDLACKCGYNVGFTLDPHDEHRPVVAQIELPTGQVTWHMRAPLARYDGHNTEEKYKRVNDFVDRYHP